MPHHKSAKKKMRHDEKRRLINRRNRGAMRTEIKKIRTAFDEGNVELVKELFKPTLSIIDKSVQKGIIHNNKADRLKSRLTKHYNKLVGVEKPAVKKTETKEEAAE